MALRVLMTVPDRTWEMLGILFGCVGAASIGYQILHEWQTPGASSVSLWFLAGFLSIYVFWFLYGVRFGRVGIWLPNAVAAVLQVVLGAVVLTK